MRSAALLALPNQHHIPNAMPAAEVTETLGLHNARNRDWSIQSAYAATADCLRRQTRLRQPEEQRRKPSSAVVRGSVRGGVAEYSYTTSTMPHATVYDTHLTLPTIYPFSLSRVSLY